ncbi:outer membrane porin, OprD family [Pseudoxanthomonas sp. NC8]|nr:outer membrane porin, OprD family [Pseudoxanthomonas sp. NC8]
MDQSFGPSRSEWIRETRRKAFEDTKFDVQARTYYLDRDKYDSSQMESWALGGSAGLKTGYFREFFAFGATGYTSQKLYGPEDKDGAGLLAPGQEGYTVLGEVYGEFLLNQGHPPDRGPARLRYPLHQPQRRADDPGHLPGRGTAGPVRRQGNGRMAGRRRLLRQDQGAHLRALRVDGQGCRCPGRGGTRRLLAGCQLHLGRPVGRCDRLLQRRHHRHLLHRGQVRLRPVRRLETSHRRAVHRPVQQRRQPAQGQEFRFLPVGRQGRTGLRRRAVHLAYTDADGNTNMQAPWSGYPGFTSVQVEDFNRDGESAWLARLGYDFKSVKGLGIYALYVDGTDPGAPTEFARNETDFNVQWKVPEGILKGLMVRLRYAEVSQSDPASDDLKDLRIMVFYDPPSL